MCFGLDWIESLLIWLVMLAVVVAVLRLLVPWVLAQLGIAGGMIMQVINIIVWAMVIIAVIIFCFDLLRCMGSFPRFH